MRVLILGKNGMLGHVVYNYLLEEGFEVYGTTTRDSDIVYDANKKMEDLIDIVDYIKPDYVVNCIGILNQVAENDKELAVRLNSLLPHYIDKLSYEKGFNFIHVSTDCVFEGNRGNYNEDDLPDAKSFYGRSKALGEIMEGKNTTLRTSIVGPDTNPNGIGLFQWFMKQENEVGGYSKVLWTGVTTIELSKVIKNVIEKKISGFHHVVNNETISKKNLLELFKKSFKKGINIKDNDTVFSEKTLVRTEKSYNFNIPTYKTMIDEMHTWIGEHENIYGLKSKEKVK